MEKLKDRIEKIWSSLLNEKSKNYLLRSKIDQSIAITNSNLSASFLGNRQMANHNTDDIKYCLNKIIEKNSTEPDVTKLNVDLINWTKFLPFYLLIFPFEFLTNLLSNQHVEHDTNDKNHKYYHSYLGTGIA